MRVYYTKIYLRSKPGTIQKLIHAKSQVGCASRAKKEEKSHRDLRLGQE